MKLAKMIELVNANSLYYTVVSIPADASEVAYVQRVSHGYYKISINEKYIKNKFIFRNLLIHELGHIYNNDIDNHKRNCYLLKSFILNHQNFKEKFEKLFDKDRFIHHAQGLLDDILINDEYLGDIVMLKMKDLVGGVSSKILGFQKFTEKSNYYYPLIEKLFSEENMDKKTKKIVILGFDNNDENLRTEEDPNPHKDKDLDEDDSDIIYCVISNKKSNNDGKQVNLDLPKNLDSKPSENKGEESKEDGNEENSEDSSSKKKKKKSKKKPSISGESKPNDGDGSEEGQETDQKLNESDSSKGVENNKNIEDLIKSILADEANEPDEEVSADERAQLFEFDLNCNCIASTPTMETLLQNYLYGVFQYHKKLEYKLDKTYLWIHQKTNGAFKASLVKTKTSMVLMNTNIVIDISGSMSHEIVKVVIDCLSWIAKQGFAHPDSRIIYVNDSVQSVQKLTKSVEFPDHTFGGTRLDVAFSDKYIDRNCDNILLISDMDTFGAEKDFARIVKYCESINKRLYGVSYSLDKTDRMYKIISDLKVFYELKMF